MITFETYYPKIQLNSQSINNQNLQRIFTISYDFLFSFLPLLLQPKTYNMKKQHMPCNVNINIHTLQTLLLQSDNAIACVVRISVLSKRSFQDYYEGLKVS